MYSWTRLKLNHKVLIGIRKEAGHRTGSGAITWSGRAWKLEGGLGVPNKSHPPTHMLLITWNTLTTLVLSGNFGGRRPGTLYLGYCGLWPGAGRWKQCELCGSHTGRKVSRQTYRSGKSSIHICPWKSPWETLSVEILRSAFGKSVVSMFICFLYNITLASPGVAQRPSRSDRSGVQIVM